MLYLGVYANCNSLSTNKADSAAVKTLLKEIISLCIPLFQQTKIIQVFHLCVLEQFLCACDNNSRIAMKGQRRDRIRNVEYKWKGPRKRSVPGPVLALGGPVWERLRWSTDVS